MKLYFLMLVIILHFSVCSTDLKETNDYVNEKYFYPIFPSDTLYYSIDTIPNLENKYRFNSNLNKKEIVINHNFGKGRNSLFVYLYADMSTDYFNIKIESPHFISDSLDLIRVKSSGNICVSDYPKKVVDENIGGLNIGLKYIREPYLRIKQSDYFSGDYKKYCHAIFKVKEKNVKDKDEFIYLFLRVLVIYNQDSI